MNLKKPQKQSCFRSDSAGGGMVKKQKKKDVKRETET